MSYSTAALVGATGGAGTTRLAVELGATLARDGREVAVLDADFATEGLARHVSGRIDPDLTKLLTEDESTANELAADESAPAERLLADGLREHPATADLAGRLELCPARAPFERLARAKTADAAERFGDLLDAARSEFDHVLVDTPPVAANQAVAAVTSAERVAVVAPASERGEDALSRARERVTDVGSSADAVIANRTAADRDRDAGDRPLRSADAGVPESDAATVADVPASAPDPELPFAPGVAAAASAVFDAELSLEFEEDGLFDFDAEEFVPDALSN